MTSENPRQPTARAAEFSCWRTALRTVWPTFREFLLNVRGGRPLPSSAVEEIINRYALIGGGSPLLEITIRQAEALAKVLELPVYVGMRNWKPYIEEAVGGLRQDQVTRVVTLCLAPQNSRTSIGLYKTSLSKAVEKVAPAPASGFCGKLARPSRADRGFSGKSRGGAGHGPS